MAATYLPLLLALVAAALLPGVVRAWKAPTTGGTTFCPIQSADWASGATSAGVIVNDNSALIATVQEKSLLVAEDCAFLCRSWYQNKAYATAALGDTSKKCAFWSFLDFQGNYVNDCYLYECGACTGSTSFNPTAQVLVTVNKVTTAYTYVSGENVETESSCQGVKGDPHFNGADNSHFDFTGEPNTTYAMISDAHVHVNMYMGGRFDQWGSDPHKALTWIREVGVLWGHHTIALRAREGASWQYGAGYMSTIEVDGRPVHLARAGDEASFVGGKVVLKWVAAQVKDADDEIDVYTVKIDGVLTLRLKLRPEVAHLRTPTDGVVHFTVEVPQAMLSENAHGVLGQTYRKDHRGRLAQQKLEYSELLGVNVIATDNAAGFLDGVAADYQVSGLLKADCPVSRFARAKGLDAETAQAIEMATAGATTSAASPFGPRKALRAAATA